MTICIASLCSNGIILGASDRMLTAGDIQFEPSTAAQKVFRVTNSIVCMTAGDSALQAEIMSEVLAAARERMKAKSDEWLSVKDVVSFYIKYRNLAKLARAESAILAPLNLDRDNFMSRQKTMPENVLERIVKELMHFEMPNVNAIVTGIDSQGPHIHVINDMEMQCLDKVGFASIGSGSRHAQSQFMLHKHAPTVTLSETLLLTYIAKKRSEVAPGVGTETDMFFIGPHPGSHSQLKPEVIAKLENEYEEITRKESEILVDSRQKIKDYVEQIQRPRAPTLAHAEDSSENCSELLRLIAQSRP